MKHSFGAKVSRFIAVPLLALPLLAALPGCNGDNDNGGPIVPTPSPTATATASPTATATATATASPTATQVANAFVGRYTGTFTGDPGQPGPINGIFEIRVDSLGRVTGTASQRQFPGRTFTASGTVNSAGQINVTLTGSIPVGPGGSLIPITSRLTGTAVTSNGVTTVSGRFLTTDPNNQPAGSGTFSGSRR